MTDDKQLPPLPEPHHHARMCEPCGGFPTQAYYAADQMRAVQNEAYQLGYSTALSAARPTTDRPTQPGWYWICEPGEDWVVEHVPAEVIPLAGIPAGTLWQRIPQPTEEGK